MNISSSNRGSGKLSLMVSRISFALILFLLVFCQELQPIEAQSWVQAGYWLSGTGFPVSDINSALYTHLICAFADLNSTSYELSISPGDEESFSSFTNTVKKKNPSISTLLSIGGSDANYSIFKSMASNASSRKSFIQSSIRIARLYGFEGLDMAWTSANTSSDMSNMGKLFEEWREASKSEAANSSSTSELILAATVKLRPGLNFTSYPVESIRSNLNWAHVVAYEYHKPTKENFAGAYAALFDPSGDVNTDSGMKEWIRSGVPSNKLLLGLPFYGYAWTLENPKENGIGAPTTGPAITAGGDMQYKKIRAYIQQYGASVQYNSTYETNYWTLGSTWICFDDVHAIRGKVSYAREMKLLGYAVWQVPYDSNWVLSRAAALQVDQTEHGKVNYGSRDSWPGYTDTSELFQGNAPDLKVFSFYDIELATAKFSIQNKLGQGGYGAVYKAYKLWKEGKGLEFADPFLDHNNSMCEILRCMQIALLCVQEDANDRPSVMEISSMLKTDTTLRSPKRPAFSANETLSDDFQYVTSPSPLLPSNSKDPDISQNSHVVDLSVVDLVSNNDGSVMSLEEGNLREGFGRLDGGQVLSLDLEAFVGLLLQPSSWMISDVGCDVDMKEAIVGVFGCGGILLLINCM
ncbi:hypothetical protein VNO78_03049 [Psophocarpus tetragonolobus]|uniref:GH18 domain-containing protein n=1 Tax=Psophocarpus tetragonolobus TaxID=3891 RepID=A0AAN9XWL3_PSOTE